MPSAAAFAALLDDLVPMAPEALAAAPLIEPSISTPKVPYKVAVG
jgi:hypothetical protein